MNEPGKLPRLRIVSDGTLSRTRVYSHEGEDISHVVRAIWWEIGVDCEVARVSVEVNATIEAEGIVSFVQQDEPEAP